MSTDPPAGGSRSRLLFFLILLLYLALAVPRLGRLGVSWDEQVDLEIARRYAETPGGWLRGSGMDPSQARLPMYAVAISLFLTGSGSLLAARLFSVLLGAATLVAVYRFCRRAWDDSTGLIACLILATSPFFLSFARVALTESDIFVTCAVAWLLPALLRLVEEGSLRWVAATGVTLGLAVASKVSAAALAPIAAGAPLLARLRRRGPAVPVRPLPRITLVLGVAIPAGLLSIWWIRWTAGGKVVSGGVEALYLLCLLIGAGWIATLLYRGSEPAPPLAAGFLVAALAFTIFMLIPPVHATDPRLLLGMGHRMLKTTGFVPARIGENAAFHFLCVLFKSSPLVGAGLWLGLAGLAVSSGPRGPKGILLAVFGVYFAFLMKMNLAQTFYMMPLLPVLAMATADSLRRLHRSAPRAAVAAALAAFALLAADLARCAPDYQLNGYQYLGEREFWGHSTVGYRSVAEVTTEGVDESLRYVMRRARPGETVTTYVLAVHVADALWSRSDLHRRDGMAAGTSALEGADWVIESFNSHLADSRGLPLAGDSIYAYPYDRRMLEAGFEKVFVVRRAFGIESAAVWRRR